jgi:hypothetical protein
VPVCTRLFLGAGLRRGGKAEKKPTSGHSEILLDKPPACQIRAINRKNSQIQINGFPTAG